MIFDSAEIERQYRHDVRVLSRWGDVRWLFLSTVGVQIGLVRTQVQSDFAGLALLRGCYDLVMLLRIAMLVSAICLPGQTYGKWRACMLCTLRITRVVMYLWVPLVPLSAAFPTGSFFSGSCHTVKLFLWDALAQHVTFTLNMCSEVAWDQVLLNTVSICIVTSAMVSQGMHCDCLEGTVEWQRTHVADCEACLRWMSIPLSALHAAMHNVIGPWYDNLALPAFMNSPCKQFTLLYMTLTSLGTCTWAYHTERGKRLNWLRQPGREVIRDKYAARVASYRPSICVLMSVTAAPVLCAALKQAWYL